MWGWRFKPVYSRAIEGAFASPFTCLGFADFLSHYGSAPDQYCLEDEGAVAAVYDEEDGKGLKLTSDVFLLVAGEFRIESN